MGKCESFFQTAVCDVGLRIAAWRGSHAENLGTKQGVIFLSDEFSYKFSIFNRLKNSTLRWKTKRTPVCSANHPKISPLAIIK